MNIGLNAGDTSDDGSDDFDTVDDHEIVPVDPASTEADDAEKNNTPSARDNDDLQQRSPREVLLDMVHELQHIVSDKPIAPAHDQMVNNDNEEINLDLDNGEQQPFENDLSVPASPLNKNECQGFVKIPTGNNERSAVTLNMCDESPEGFGVDILFPFFQPVIDNVETEEAPNDPLPPNNKEEAVVNSVTDMLQNTQIESSNSFPNFKRILETPVDFLLYNLTRPFNSNWYQYLSSKFAKKATPHQPASVEPDVVDPAVTELAEAFATKLSFRDATESAYSLFDMSNGQSRGVPRVARGGSTSRFRRLNTSQFEKVNEVAKSIRPNFELLIVDALRTFEGQRATRADLFEVIISNNMFSIPVYKAHTYFISKMKKMILFKKILVVTEGFEKFYCLSKRVSSKESKKNDLSGEVDEHSQTAPAAPALADLNGTETSTAADVHVATRTPSALSLIFAANRAAEAASSSSASVSTETDSAEVDDPYPMVYYARSSYVYRGNHKTYRGCARKHPPPCSSDCDFQRPELKLTRYRPKPPIIDVDPEILRAFPYSYMLNGAIDVLDHGSGATLEALVNYVKIRCKFHAESQIKKCVLNYVKELIKLGKVRTLGPRTYRLIKAQNP